MLSNMPEKITETQSQLFIKQISCKFFLFSFQSVTVNLVLISLYSKK